MKFKAQNTSHSLTLWIYWNNGI